MAASRRRRTTAVTATLAAVVLTAGLTTGCSAVDKALDRVRTADAIAGRQRHRTPARAAEKAIASSRLEHCAGSFCQPIAGVLHATTHRLARPLPRPR
ncbi:hypothetical protein SHIRM173S_05311 [Streptomyces hirsutus]